MILESILVVTFALILDLIVGDPKNKFHPTSWIGTLIAKIVPIIKNKSPNVEKIGGIILVVSVTALITTILVFLNIEINNNPIDFVASIVSVVVGVILLKTTIAIRGMEKHAIAVMLSIEKNDQQIQLGYY